MDGPDGIALHLNETEIDGVRTWWARADGPLVGSLQFGVGRAMEPAALGGITHLVEHLALAPLAQLDHPHNGFVAPRRTVFTAAGTPDELTAFFQRTIGGLRQLPLERVAVERRVLRQEGRGRPAAIVPMLLWLRYGNAGYGLLATDELGLSWLGPEPVQTWADRHFTRENAVAWFSGPPPAGIRFDLPPGSPPPLPAVEPLAAITWPAHVTWNSSGAALSWLLPRDAASVVAVRVAASRARGALRFEQGLVYDVLSDYEPLDRHTAHGYIGADCAPEHVTSVRDGLLGALEGIASDGVTDAELQREIRAFRDSFGIPEVALRLLDAAASDHLEGRPNTSAAALLAEYEALTPGLDGASLASALDSRLLLAPGPTPGGSRWTSYPLRSPGAVRGRSHRPPGWPWLNSRRRDRLVVSAEGATWVGPDGAHLTVRTEDCVAYVHEHAWGTERRQLLGVDGFTVGIDAHDWHDGRKAIGALDAAIPSTSVVCAIHGLGGMPDVEA